MEHRIVCGLVATLGVAAGSSAQSINIDFGDLAGTPAADYGAAGPLGTWNTIVIDSGIPVQVLDLSGLPTNATLVHSGFGYQDSNSQTTTGDDSALLRDYLFDIDPDFTIEFFGLLPGEYAVYTYSYFTETFPFPSTVWVNDDLGTAQEVAGRFESGFAVGMSHALHIVDIVDGSLAVTVANPGDSLVNGVQLVRIPGPGALSVTIVAGVVVRRRRRRLAAQQLLEQISVEHGLVTGLCGIPQSRNRTVLSGSRTARRGLPALPGCT